MNCKSTARRGFTLVELLVVIGIIALLISILLPSLSEARKSANTIKCAANIRSIIQAMQGYASENRDAMPGSAWTNNRVVYRDPQTAALGSVGGAAVSNANLPGSITIFDWWTPVARYWKIRFNEGATQADRVERYQQLSQLGGFRCPTNDILAPSFTAVNVGTSPMPSYNMPWGMAVRYNASTTSGFAQNRTLGHAVSNGTSIQSPPEGWNNTISKVGDTTRKVALADGGRYSNGTVFPDVDISFTGQGGGPFADQGPAFKFSNSWYRGFAPGNGATTGRDPRPFAYRHGKYVPNGRADTFRMNVGFWDGHVQAMGDLESADPHMWFPKGTILSINDSQVWPDVKAKYFRGVDNNRYVVP